MPLAEQANRAQRRARPPKGRRRALGWGLAGLAAAALVVIMLKGGLDRLVESQIFFPDPVLVATPAQAGLEYQEVRLHTSDGLSLHGWLVPAKDSGSLILFCHGNAGNISHRLDNILRLNRIGASVFIFDYRGYGQSQGRPSEEGLYRDARAAADYARQQAESAGQKLVFFGRSLGGVAAVYLASQEPCHGLILESAFTNLGDMAAIHFPLPGAGRLLARRLDALGRMSLVRAPMLLLHGDQDQLVPMEMGRRLYEAAQGPKQWVTLAGAGHNDTYLRGGRDYFETWRAFLAGLPPQPIAPAEAQ